MAINKTKIRQGVKLLLEGVGESVKREGLRHTPERIAEFYEEALSGIDADPTVELRKYTTWEQEFFGDLMATLYDPRYWILIAMREDYIAGLEPYLSYFPERLNARYRLEFLEVEQAIQAVRLRVEQVQHGEEVLLVVQSGRRREQEQLRRVKGYLATSIPHRLPPGDTVRGRDVVRFVDDGDVIWPIGQPTRGGAGVDQVDPAVLRVKAELLGEFPSPLRQKERRHQHESARLRIV